MTTDMSLWKYFLKEKNYCKHENNKPICDLGEKCSVCLDINIFNEYKKFIKSLK